MTTARLVATGLLGLLFLGWPAAAAYFGTRPAAPPADKTSLWFSVGGLLAIPLALAVYGLTRTQSRFLDYFAFGPLVAGVAFAICYSGSPPGWLASFYLVSAIIFIPVGLILGLVGVLAGPGGWH